MAMNSRIACVGAGYWGKNLVRNFHELGVLSTVCDTDPGRLKSVAEQYPGVSSTEDVQQVLKNSTIDGVAIATPAETHAALVKQAFEAGKDVFVEKPLALTVAEGQELIDLARRTGKLLMIGHLLWYHPAVLKLKELIDAGELGKIQYIYSNRLNLGKFRREENILWSFAPHDISVILGLLGEMPESVQALGGNFLHPRIADVTVSMLSFPSGVRAHIFVSWLHPFKEQKLVVVGDRKMAVFNDVEEQDKLLLFPHKIGWEHQVPVAMKAEAEPVPVPREEPLRTECRHFLECVQTRRPPRTDGAEALRVLTVLQQCQEVLEMKQSGGATANRKYWAHESAFIDEDVEIGEGTVVWHVSHIMKGSRIGHNCRIGQNAVIGPRVTIGDGVKIQNNVSVYEGVTLEDYVFCGPSMVFTNVINPRSEIPRMKELKPTLVRRGATLGANSTILCGVTIGRYAFVGAGAVVTRDVPDHGLMVGVPAELKGWMCECGLKLTVKSGKKASCACGRGYMLKGKSIQKVETKK